MAYFQLLDKILENPIDRVNLETLSTGEFFLDDVLISKLQKKVQKSTLTILLGPQNSGKTLTSKALGNKLQKKGDFLCLYGDARELDNIPEIIREIEAYEEFEQRTLLIIENCHANINKIESLLNRLKKERKNTALLLTSRHVELQNSMLSDYGIVFQLEPAKLRKSIIENYIKLKQAKYASAPFLPKNNEDMENQANEIIKELKTTNLKLIDLYLQAWDPFKESLVDLDEEKVLNYFLTSIKSSLSSLSLQEAQDCLLPLCALDQYEINVNMSFLNVEALEQLRKKGLVFCNDFKGLCKLHESSDAIWYLKAAEKTHNLQLEKRPVNVEEYVKYYIIKYSVYILDPQYLLRSLRYNKENKLAREVINNPDFQDYLSSLVKESYSLIELPVLLYELRMLNRFDLCHKFLYCLNGNDINNIGKEGIKTLGIYLNEFSAWGLKGKSSTQRRYLLKSSDLGLEGREFAQQLMERQTVKPKTLANEFMEGLNSGELTITNLADFVYNLSWLGTYDVCKLLEHLDFSIIKAKFSTTNVRYYADLLAVFKKSRCGIKIVKKLIPDSEMIVLQLYNGTGRDLRDMMDALLMPDRIKLFEELKDEQLQEIINHSTLNQLYNILLDALESKNEKSKQLGREIATRLIKLDLSSPMKWSSITDLTMFTHVVLGLRSDLDRKLFDQILPHLDGIIQKSHQKYSLNKLSLLLRDFQMVKGSPSGSPVAIELFQELTRLNLLPIFQSSEGGLIPMTYWAIMIDEELSSKWFLTFDQQIWKDKILEVSKNDAFWIIWNVWQVEPSLACSLANDTKIYEKIASIPYGIGLLMLCDITSKNTSIILPQLTHILVEPWDPIKLVLALKVLSLPSLQDTAIKVREDIDLEKLTDTIYNAIILENTKEVLIKIIVKFKTLTDRFVQQI